MKTVYLGVIWAQRTDINPNEWTWTITGSDGRALARSVTSYPTEHDARAASWEMYQALRRGEGDRKKWGG